jgi:hypothetical protein
VCKYWQSLKVVELAQASLACVGFANDVALGAPIRADVPRLGLESVLGNPPDLRRNKFQH